MNDNQTTSHKTKSRDMRWLIGGLIALLVAAGVYLYFDPSAILAQGQVAQNGGIAQVDDIADEGAPSTVMIQPATIILGEVSAAGNLALINERSVVADVDGEVVSIDVKSGHQIRAGDLLLEIDSTEHERALRRAELAVDSAQNSLDALTKEATLTEVAVAQAAVTQAQESLAEVMAGPSEEELAAARSTLTSAQAKVNELYAGPSDNELTQLSADLKQSEIDLAEAQRAYDQIKWQGNAGTTTQAADLQSATIAYESALASYNQSVEPEAQSEIASAQASVQDAQHALDELENSPTSAEIASAQAELAEAQSTLEDLLAGADETELKEAEIALEQALIDLEEAASDLAATKVVAPVDGTVLTIDAAVGEQLSQGAVAITLADTTQLELTIDVAEVDIVQVELGQAATVEIDALTGQSFEGVVDYVAPSGDSESGIVTYQVTVRLTDESIEKLLPGMTAVANIVNGDSAASTGWLVPTNAIQQRGENSVVLIARGEETVPVAVETGAIQGEWTVVRSPELQNGDQVVGSLTSYINEEEIRFGPGGGGPPPDGGQDGGGRTGGGGPFGRG